MACVLTSGRTEPCKDSVGGLKAVYFATFVEDAFTVTAGQATDIDAALTVAYKFDLRANENTFNQSPVSDRSTGVTLNTQTLVIRLKKQDAATAVQVDALTKGRVLAVVEGYDGTFKVMGLTDGCDVTASDIQSGGAKGDFNGYELTLTAEEPSLAPHLDGDTITAFLALVSATVIAP